MGKGSRTAALSLAVVAGILASAELHAQDPTPRVRGTVTALDDDAPLEGAQVQIVERGLSVLTGADGSYAFFVVPPGSYTLRVDRIGYRTSVQVLTVGDARVEVDVPLETAVLRLEEIVVSPGRFGVMDGAASVRQQQTLTRDDLETVPQVGEDVFRVLRTIPGVAVDDISTRLNVRGGGDYELLNLLDGVELYEPYHLKDFDGVFGIVDVQSIGGIELITGGYGPEYGDKLTGVFGMTSRSAPITGTRTTVGLSVSNASVMSRGSFAEGKGEWLAQARRGYLDILLALTDSNDPDEELSPGYFDVFAKARYELAENHRLSFNVLYAGDDLTFAAEEGRVDSRWTSGYGWATWDARIGDVSATTMAFGGSVDRRRDGNIEDPEARTASSWRTGETSTSPA